MCAKKDEVKTDEIFPVFLQRIFSLLAQVCIILLFLWTNEKTGILLFSFSRRFDPTARLGSKANNACTANLV
jgi:hypothetical protein